MYISCLDWNQSSTSGRLSVAFGGFKSASKALTLIVQDTIAPYRRVRARVQSTFIAS